MGLFSKETEDARYLREMREKARLAREEAGLGETSYSEEGSFGTPEYWTIVKRDLLKVVIRGVVLIAAVMIAGVLTMTLKENGELRKENEEYASQVSGLKSQNERLERHIEILEDELGLEVEQVVPVPTPEPQNPDPTPTPEPQNPDPAKDPVDQPVNSDPAGY